MKGKLKIATSYIIVLFVALVMAVNYQLFVFPNSFAPAGVNGLLTMIQYALGIKVSFASIMINIPLALICFLLPAVLSLGSCEVLRKIGWIREGDLKLEL